MRAGPFQIALAIHLVASALFAGGCLYGARVDGPYASACTPEGFASFMRAVLGHAGSWMFPPLVVAALASLPLAAMGGRPWAIVSVLLFTILAITMTVHVPLNVELMRGGALSPSRIDAIRHRWLLAHEIRSALALAAFAWAAVLTAARVH